MADPNLTPDLEALLQRAGGGVPQPATPSAAPSPDAKPAAGAGQPRGFLQDMANEPIVYGLRHGVATLGLGAHRVADGLNDLVNGKNYDEKVQGAAAVVNGLFQMGISPFTAPAASIRKALEQSYPDLAKTEILDPQFAGFVRTMMGNIPRKVSPEKYAAMTSEEQGAYRKSLEDVSAPFSFGEGVETAITMVGPLMAAEAMRKPQETAKKPGASSAAPATPEPVDRATAAVEAPKQAPVDPALLAERDALTTEVAQMRERLTVTPEEAAKRGNYAFEGQVPLTGPLQALYYKLTDVNGRIAEATQAAETAVSKVEDLAKPKTPTETQLEMQKPKPLAGVDAYLRESGPYQDPTPEMLRDLEGSVPPPAEGTVRLYRAEDVSGRGPYAADMPPGGDLYFTRSLERAMGIAKDIPDRKAKITYLDMPAADAAATEKNVTGLGNVLEEHTVPPDTAATRKTLADITPEDAQGFVDRVQTDATPTVPPAGAEGPRMFGINWQRLGQEESVNRVILDVNKGLSESGASAEAARGVRSHEVTTEAARGLQMTVEDALTLQPGTAVNAEQMTALRGIRDVAARSLFQQSEMAIAGDTSARADMPTLIALNHEINLRVKGATTETARALEAMKMPSALETSGTSMKNFADLVQRLNGVTDIDKAAEMIQGVKRSQGRGAVGRFMDNMAHAALTGKDILWEVWINDLLGPVTAGAKALGDTMMLAKEPGQIALARWNQKVFPFLFRDMPAGEAITAGEASRFAGAAAQAVPNAVMQAIRGVRNGEIDMLTAVGEDRTYPNKLAIDVSQNPWQVQDAPAYAVNVVGSLIRAPGTTLGIITKVAKAANYAGAASAEALRQAVEVEGRTEKADINRRVQYIVEHPAEFPYIADSAAQVARDNTFTSDLGPFGQALTDTLNRAHMRSQAPFLRVPINLEKVGTQAIFPFNIPSMLMGDLRRDFEAGGARRATAMANVEAGAAFAAFIAYLTANRIVTGPGPMDPTLQKQRELAGEPVHSIIIPDSVPGIGGKSYDYNRIKPVGTMIGLTAGVTEAWAQLPNDSSAFERVLQVATIHALAWGRVIQEASYFTGIKHMTDAIGAKDATAASTAQQLLTSSARSLAPNTYARTPNRLYFDGVMREAHTVTEAFLAGVPGYSQDLAPHRDVIKGEPMEYPPSVGPGLVSPLSYREVNPDPVYKMLSDNQIPVRALPWVAPTTGIKPKLFSVTEPDIPNEGVPLTSQQRDRWVVLMTQEVRANGRLLYDELAHLMTVPSFQSASNGPNGAKASIVMNTVNAYRDAALLRLYGEDHDLGQTVLARQRAKIEGKWLPTTDPRSPQFGGGKAASGTTFDPTELLKSLGR